MSDLHSVKAAFYYCPSAEDFVERNSSGERRFAVSVKQNIVEQSIRLFETKGFSETSIQDVVEALGVTKGTFYYYFKSKQELLTQIHLTYIENLLDEQEKIVQDEKKTYKEILYNNILLVIKSICP